MANSHCSPVPTCRNVTRTEARTSRWSFGHVKMIKAKFSADRGELYHAVLLEEVTLQLHLTNCSQKQYQWENLIRVSRHWWVQNLIQLIMKSPNHFLHTVKWQAPWPMENQNLMVTEELTNVHCLLEINKWNQTQIWIWRHQTVQLSCYLLRAVKNNLNIGTTYGTLIHFFNSLKSGINPMAPLKIPIGVEMRLFSTLFGMTIINLVNVLHQVY